MSEYKHGGAEALVRLHDRHMRTFLPTWQRARVADLRLPRTDDPDYASLDALLYHVMGAARFYMRWCCHVLELEDPGIEEVPAQEELSDRAEAYMNHVLEHWDGPLRDVDPKRFEDKAFMAPWDSPFTVDGMLEHAVMHPIRHEFQLARLLKAGGAAS